jgi:hypothetical protein
MNRRNLIILGGAAVAAVGAAVVLTPGTPTGPDPDTAALAFPGLAPRLAAAARLEVKRHDGTLVVARQGEAWVLPDKAGYPVRQEKMRELLVGLTELRLTEPRTADPEMLGRLGLDDPAKEGSTAALLRLLDAAGTPIAELVTGRRRVRTQGNVPESIYVRRPNENQAWLAEGRLPVDADPQLWIDRDLANLPRDRVRHVVVNRTGTPVLEITKGGDPDGRFAVTVPDGAPPSEETALDEIGRGFEYLTFTDVQPAGTAGEAPREAPGEALGETRFDLTDNLAITVRGWRQEEQIWVTLSAAGDDEATRLNARWRGWRYQVGAWKEKAFFPRLEDLKREERQPPAGALPPGFAPPGMPGAAMPGGPPASLMPGAPGSPPAATP